jgi:hypothetical protein
LLCFAFCHFFLFCCCIVKKGKLDVILVVPTLLKTYIYFLSVCLLGKQCRYVSRSRYFVVASLNVVWRIGELYFRSHFPQISYYASQCFFLEKCLPVSFAKSFSICQRVCRRTLFETNFSSSLSP